jgi:chromosome segregation ATPase
MLVQNVEGARTAAAAATAELQDQHMAAVAEIASQSEAVATLVATLGQQLSSSQQQLESLAAKVASTKSQVATWESVSVSRDEYSSLSAVVSETMDGLNGVQHSIDGVRDTLSTSQDALRKDHGDALHQQQLVQRTQAERLEELAAAVAAGAVVSATDIEPGAIGLSQLRGVVNQHIHDHL